MFKNGKARVLSVVCASLVVASAAVAQQFPTKPIRIVVGFGAGGGTDNIARLYAAKLSELLNTPVVVENRPGASELLAAQAVMSAEPDGHTMWMGTAGSLALGPGLRSDLPYEPLKNFVPLALIGEAQALLVVKNSLPVNSLRELVSYAKANPGKLNYGSAGVGITNHLRTERLMALTDISMVHIPYKSDAENIRAVLAGDVDFAMAVARTAVPLVLEGKVKAIAVTGRQSLKQLPSIPIVAESGIPELKVAESYTFYGLMGPARMPAAIVQKINEAINKIGEMPDVARTLQDNYAVEPYKGSAGSFARYLEKELEQWRPLRSKVKFSP